MNLADTLWIFTLGFLLGVVAVIAYGTYKLKQLNAAKESAIKKIEDTAESLRSEIEKGNSVKNRLNNVQQITKKQLELSAHLDMPSKNALHSKYKNELTYEIKRLEEEKNEILRSILKEGFDPLVTVINSNNEQESVKLSEYMTRAGIDTGLTEENNVTPDNPNGPRKVGKFIVYNGGNNSDTTH